MSSSSSFISSRALVTILCLAPWMFAAPLRATAALIAVDDFETYTPGSLAGANGGTGTWTGPYAATNTTVVAGGLSYSVGAININGGTQAASIGNAGTSIPVVREFESQTDTLYFSLLYKPVSGVTNADFLQFILDDNGNQHSAVTYGVRNSGSGDTGFFARVRDGSTDTITRTTVQQVADETYLLVGKVWKDGTTNYNRMDFYLNPTTLTEPVGDAITAVRDTGIAAIDTFAIRTAALTAGDRYDFDVLRIGTSYSEVVAPTAIPEPSSLALAGLAAAGFVGRRSLRRRLKAPLETA